MLLTAAIKSVTESATKSIPMRMIKNLKTKNLEQLFTFLKKDINETS